MTPAQQAAIAALQRDGFALEYHGRHVARMARGNDYYYQRIGAGPSILVAACRARVRVVLGETVKVPAELLADAVAA